MQDYIRSLTPGAEQQIDVSGDVWRIIAATDAVQLSIDGGPWITRAKGQGQKHAQKPFRTIRVRSAVAQSVTIVAGFGEVYDDAESVAVTVSATVEPGNTLPAGGDVALPAGGAAQIVAADADRLALIVRNPASNAAAVRVGGAGLGATGGIELEPGEAITLATTAAVWGYSTAAQSVNVLPVRAL